MSTKNTVSLMSVIAGLVPLFAWLAAKHGFGAFVFVAVIASVVSLGLLAYAAFREKTTEDKSERLSPKAAAMILCGIGIWVVFCFYRALMH